MADPLVHTTEVTAGGVAYRLPQLGPLSQYEWLNEDRFAREFPDEAARGAIRHYTELPGHEPSNDVLNALRHLGSERGVLIFDHPAGDDAYPVRLRESLARAQVRAGEVIELAQQTYFVGTVHLLRDRPPGVAPRDVLTTAATDFRASSNDQVTTGAFLRLQVDVEDVSRFRTFYERAYEELNELEFCKQGLDPDEFGEMLSQSTDVLKVLNAVEGTVVALMLLTPSLERLGWINAQYFRDRYSQQSERGQLLWFPGLAADPSHPQSGNTQPMVNLLGALHEEAMNEPLVLFDCGILNTGFLPPFVEALINQTTHFEISMAPIAQHKYAAMRLSTDP